MDLHRNAQLVVSDATTSAEWPLSPVEFFVLSRIEGKMTVADVLHTSGLAANDAEAALRKLVELGIVLLGAPVESGRPVAPSASRQRALQSQLQAARAAASQPTPPRRVSEPEPVVEPPPEDPMPVPMVGPNDPRLEQAIALTRMQQRRVLALFDRLLELSPFELLGMRPTHDIKAIRRAYHSTSRELHPDAYFGQELGNFRPMLDALFRRVTQAQEALQHEEVRAPFVDEEITRRAEARHRQAMVAAQRQQAAEIAREQEEAEAAARRYNREVDRARRQRARLQHSVRERIETHLRDASAAEGAGNLASATNNYRLALSLVPTDAEIRGHWERCRDLARRRRAEEAFQRALTYRDIGHAHESVPLLVEAAEAHPTVVHLAFAAEAVGATDPVKARDFALQALDRLATEPETVRNQRKPGDLAQVHVLLARAFIAAGQMHTAR
ncbi:MAG TPA: J domain-containing protein, partial [Nannocystaceae bacterium]|nr:J domain-containing protein [Nannocystaceae bacterium]